MIINMTPHEVTLVGENGEVIRRFPPSGELVRLSVQTAGAGEFDGVPLTRTEFGEPEGLPPVSEGTRLIVSAMVKSALPERADLLVPNEAVRDPQGRIIGCRSLGV